MAVYTDVAAEDLARFLSGYDIGELLSYRIQHGEQTFAAISLKVGSPAEGKSLPDLYEPVLEGFAVLAFVLRGYERIEAPEGAIGVVQEWHCREP